MGVKTALRTTLAPLGRGERPYLDGKRALLLDFDVFEKTHKKKGTDKTFWQQGRT